MKRNLLLTAASILCLSAILTIAAGMGWQRGKGIAAATHPSPTISYTPELRPSPSPTPTPSVSPNPNLLAGLTVQAQRTLIDTVLERANYCAEASDCQEIPKKRYTLGNCVPLINAKEAPMVSALLEGYTGRPVWVDCKIVHITCQSEKCRWSM